MATVTALKKSAPNMTVGEAVAALQCELAAELPRKTAIAAIIDVQLGAILAAVSVPATVAAPKILGTLTAGRSGVIVVIDADLMEDNWKIASRAQQGYVVDITGDQAEYLAKTRGGPFRQEPIPGGVRVICTNETEAGGIKDAVETLVDREAWDTQVVQYSKGASKVVALDATRAAGGRCAMATAPAALKMAVVPATEGQQVRIAVDDSGKLIIG